MKPKPRPIIRIGLFFMSHSLLVRYLIFFLFFFLSYSNLIFFFKASYGGKHYMLMKGSVMVCGSVQFAMRLGFQLFCSCLFLPRAHTFLKMHSCQVSLHELIHFLASLCSSCDNIYELCVCVCVFLFFLFCFGEGEIGRYRKIFFIFHHVLLSGVM